MTIITQTPRLIIRQFNPDEMETYLAHFNDEEVALHIPKRSREERVNIFNTALQQYAHGDRIGIWGMFDSDTGTFIGSCLLRPFDGDDTILELGYSMDRKYWGRGLATEMAVATIAYGFNDPNVTEMVACTTFENIASRRVLEKAGFKQADNLMRGGEELAFFRLSR